MTFIQVSTIVVGSTLLVAWWLSRYDARVVGDGGGWAKLRRFLRCTLTAGMAELIFWCCWRYSHERDVVKGLITIPLILVLAFFWAGAVGELASRGFGHLFDSDGRRAFDPGKGEEGLRLLGQLVEEGRQEEAVRLSERLKRSGDTDIIVLEAMMQHLGLNENHADKAKSLAVARQLQAERRFTEAERVLTGLLRRHPDFTEAAVLQIKIYAQDLRQDEAAEAAFEKLKKQSGTSPGMLEFARSLLADAERTKSESVPLATPERTSEPVDVLIAQRRFGTAITAMKERLREHPGDFDTWLKLCEVNGRLCGSMQQVENIIKLLEVDPLFRPEQIEILRVKLQEWRAEWKIVRKPSAPAEKPLGMPSAVAETSGDSSSIDLTI